MFTRISVNPSKSDIVHKPQPHVNCLASQLATNYVYTSPHSSLIAGVSTSTPPP